MSKKHHPYAQCLEPYIQYLNQRKNKKLYRTLGTVHQGPRKVYVDFSHNDYLGLNHQTSVAAGAIRAVQKYGTGAAGAPLLSGYSELYQELATEIANSKKTDATLIFNSGFQANSSSLAALLDLGRRKDRPLVFFDKHNHASLYQAVFLSQVEMLRYRHNDLNHLESLLERYKNDRRIKFIVAEVIFGMDGDTLPWADITFLAKKHNALLYLDEAHAIGLLGDHGHGLTNTLSDTPFVIMGNFSKALGAGGGYVTSSQIISDYLVNRASGFIYSTALAPALLGAAQAAWRLLPQLDGQRRNLRHLSHQLRTRLHDRGYDTGRSDTHIVPIIFGCVEKTIAVQKKLAEKGVLVSAIRPPSVPPNTARLRISLSAEHQEHDLARLLLALDEST